MPGTGAADPPLGQAPPVAQPGLRESAWQLASPDGAALTVGAAKWCAGEPECSACIVQGAVARAMSETHIGKPTPPAATANAAVAATVRRAEE
ncbi:MAG: hypothetical protein HY560_12910 [Gemmatimonadetes bacterium]|nr:hypothetical protein [Gemmatimonadota bacterium]